MHLCFNCGGGAHHLKMCRDASKTGLVSRLAFLRSLSIERCPTIRFPGRSPKACNEAIL